MKKGDYVKTPRFLTVKIEDVFDNVFQAYEAGYTEPTHYTWKNKDGYDVLGKMIGTNRMNFAAVKI